MSLRHLHRTALLLGLLVFAPARAEVLMLVHGWSADADTWLRSGVLANLAARGWPDGGVVAAGPDGHAYFPVHASVGIRTVYRAQLPAAAPLPVQAAQLHAELLGVRLRHPDERIILVGHSAGGLVARLALLQPRTDPRTQQTPLAQMLITLGTPHLGTLRATQGLAAVESKPFFCPGPGIDLLKHMAGGDDYRYLRSSRSLLYELQPAVYGSLLDWLNHQPHPDIAYFAVVRGGPYAAGDELVPAVSQDMNQVPALSGRARVVVVPTGHGLLPADGLLLADILDGRY
ncbi:MAG TPA: alpha/beta fold hydrolase [Gammaproteobacteria bacterium]